MPIHRRVKQVCIAFVFALAMGITILFMASAGTSNAPTLTTPATTASQPTAGGGPSIPDDPPNLPRGYALVAGIYDYPGTGNDLSYCVPDASGVADMLKSNGFAPANVYTLLDGAATETGISAKIAQIAALMDNNDVFVMYYSGHGIYGTTGTAPGTCAIHTPHPYANYYYNYWTIHHEGALGIRVRFDNFVTESGYDVGFIADPYLYGYGYSGNRGSFWSSWILGDTCLVGLQADNTITAYGFDVVAYEIITGMNTSIVTYDYSTSGGMYGNELDASLACLPAGSQQILAFDSCMSGGMLVPLNQSNRAVMSACATSEYSIESPYLGHGVFTYYFLQSFAKTGSSFTYDTNHDGNVSVSEMYAHAAPATTSYALNYDSDQHPQLSNNLAGTGAWDLDADNDGLYNWQETDTYFSNPLSGDSDGDGLADGAEVNTYHTNPALSDSDGDALGDYAEVFTHHTDPASADSDADGLDDGAEVGTYFADPLVSDSDYDDLDDGAEVYTYQSDPLDEDSDDDSLHDGAEVNQYHTSPVKADTDGDGFADDYEIRLGWDPLSWGEPWGGIIAGICVPCGIVMIGIGSWRYNKAHPRTVRARPSPYFPRPAPVTDTSIATLASTSRFAPAYHAPDATGHLVPMFKGHPALDWSVLAESLERRGYWNEALAAAEIARQLRQVEANPPRCVRDENERAATFPRHASLPVPVTTPVIDSFLADPAPQAPPDPAPVDEITIDEFAEPTPLDLRPIPAPEAPVAPVTPPPAGEEILVPPVPAPDPVPGLQVAPPEEIIPLCHLCGGMMKNGTCEHCGGKVCPKCGAANFATASTCGKCFAFL